MELDTGHWSNCDDNKTLDSYCEQDCSKYSKTSNGPDWFEGDKIFLWCIVICLVLTCVLWACMMDIEIEIISLIKQVVVRDSDEKTALLHRPLIKGRDCKDVEVGVGGGGGGGGGGGAEVNQY